jgi:DNA repair protein RadC
VQLLALLFGTGSRELGVEALALKLLEHAGSLASIPTCARDALTVEGIGPAKAARLLSAIELGRRILAEEPRTFIRHDLDVLHWARGRLAELEHEEVWMLSLDARSRLKATSKLAQGGIHGCALTPKDVLRPAVRNAASAIVLVHNHPSGDPSPSSDDIEMTRVIAQACELVGVPLLDHVVVARGGCASIGARLHR